VPEGPRQLRDLPQVGAAARRAAGGVVREVHRRTEVGSYAEVDLGDSAGTYYRLVNRRTGQVIGTGNKTNDANLGNGDTPDVVHGGTTLLNRSGGRAAAIWTGNATAGQKIGQWVDNSGTGSWNLVKTSDGFYKLQSVKNTSLYLTGASAGAQLTLGTALTDGSQDWELVR
jgi:hypothetical protein